MATAKSADDARRSAISKKSKFKPAKPLAKPMTKTVISYDKATGVKILQPGSRPLTQSKTNIEQMIQKAKGNTPTAKAQRKVTAKLGRRQTIQDVRNNRQDILNQTMRNAWGETKPNQRLTPAQIKAGNAAYAAKEKELKAKYAAAKKAALAKAAAEAKAAALKAAAAAKSGGMGRGSGSSGGSAFTGSSSGKIGITYTK